MNLIFILPLALLVVLVNSKQLKNDLEYRFKVFSVVGVANFFLAYYFFYFCKIIEFDKSIAFAGSFTIVFLACILCITPVIKKHNLVMTGGIAFFATSSITSIFLADSHIKNIIADKSGYFEHAPFAVIGNKESIYSSIRFEHTTELYSLEIPSFWQPKRLATGEQYFLLMEDATALLEFRPKCITNLKIDLPTLITNITDLHSREGLISTASQCSFNPTRSKNSLVTAKECIVRSKFHGTENQAEKERWHWILMPDDRKSSGAEIDILFFTEDLELRKTAHNVLSSTKLGKQTNKNKHQATCSTPSAWF